MLCCLLSVYNYYETNNAWQKLGSTREKKRTVINSSEWFCVDFFASEILYISFTREHSLVLGFYDSHTLLLSPFGIKL